MSQSKNFKKSMMAFVVGVLILTPALANATVNTMDLVDVIDNGSTKTCIYSNGHRTETIERSGASACPSSKTFH
ncbi:hypothetical protein Hena1_00660 [Erwinia phage Hena1]|uniref:Uncharacterized protein n=1 Tax=Erwinia phage Hena1 TaxID=2678601 RepID=A0A6B9JCA2_9CAUD|nr:hypothetical protein HWC84_gp065 [Erwinia phage Hena1]QGZ16242.1 hypothetical protein Hena1_00660 [Erwinia phage Hena1]